MTIEDKITEKLKKVKVKDIMTRSVITTRQSETLSDIADLLIKTKISGMPVIDQDHGVVGIITATDLFNVMGKINKGGFAAVNPQTRTNPLVQDVMTRDVVTITEGDTLFDVVNIMCDKGIHTLPVLREKKLIGVVGRRDVMMYFYAAVRDSIEELNQESTPTI